MTPILTHYNICDGVVAFSTTRHGGVSKGNYGEFNINPYCGDDKNAVAANRMSLASYLDIPVGNIYMPHQVHGVKNVVVDDDFLKAPKRLRNSMLEGIDSIMCDKKGICVGVSTADCIPILLYDPVHHVSAAVHAGWRGTIQRIVEKTLHEMIYLYGTDTAKVKAVIGPGISQKDFEVGDEVYDKFASEGFDMNVIARRFPCSDAPDKEKWHINLPMCNRLQMESLGVSLDNMTLYDISTYSDVFNYFSARRLGQASGRIYTAIMITG